MYMYSIVSSTVQDGLSPLYVASHEGHSQIVDILLLKGADPNLTCTVCVLVWSLYLLHVYCVLVELRLTNLKNRSKISSRYYF